MMAEVGGKKGAEKQAYRKFVETGMAEDDADFKIAMGASPRSIGAEDFSAWVNERYQALTHHHTVPEDVAFRHVAKPLPVELILRTTAELLGVDVGAFLQRRRNSPLRAVAAYMQIRYGGQTQRQVAQHLQVGTGGAISVHVKRLPGLLANDRALRRKAKRIEMKLTELRREASGG